ncbi:MAG: hypothetical protein WCY19_02155 [Candidatus Gastranaerophilaceae bacterium]
MLEKTTNEKKITSSVITQSAFSNEEDTFTSLSTTALLAKNAVPYSHKRAADNYVIIKRIYKFQVVQSRITHRELGILKKYDFNPLEFSTIKQVNEELSYLKKWAFSANGVLSQDADEIIQIRAKELKFIIASKYSILSDEIYDGYKALERYFEEITKFYRQ